MRWIFYVVSLTVLVSAPIIALRNEHLLISNINVLGNSSVEVDEIKSLVTAHLAGFYFKLLPKSDFLLLKREQIVRDLLTAIPRLSYAAVTLSSIKDLEVEVTERKPYALYCKGECYFMDEYGFVFAPAPSFSEGVYLIFESEPVIESPIGKSFLEPELFAKVDGFVTNLKDLGFFPKKLIKTGEEYVLEVQNKTQVRWRESQHLAKLFSDLGSFMQSSKLKPSDIDSLSYMDLRFENKIFFK